MSELSTTPKDMKKVIHSGIRSALLTHGDATKVELSGMLGVSFPTISKFISQMEQDGEVTLVGMDESSGGRRAQRYAYNPEFMLGLAIFLERKETNYLVYNSFGEVKEQGETNSMLDQDIDQLCQFIEKILEEHHAIRSISIGVPGVVDQGILVQIPGYMKYYKVNLQSIIEERFAIPTVIENDMNAAVLGYYSKMKTDENPSLVYLYLGQHGPGSGILINGDVVRGSTFFSGEIASIPQYDHLNFQQALWQANKDEGGKAIQSEQAVDAISRLVATLSSIINPHSVIFAEDEFSEEMLLPIAKQTLAYIPSEHLPRLTRSNWKRDYLNGLQSLGLKIMIDADL